MNRLLVKFFASAAVVLSLLSCEKSLGVEETLEVNKNNISGLWKLDNWDGNNAMEGSFFYIRIVRNDNSYTIWQNMDAFPDAPRKITGSYALENIDGTGYVISGVYDHDNGFWSHEYVIDGLTKDRMRWTATDSDFRQDFVRVESLPFEE